MERGKKVNIIETKKIKRKKIIKMVILILRNNKDKRISKSVI